MPQSIPESALTWQNPALTVLDTPGRVVIARYHERVTWRRTRSGRYKGGWPESREVWYTLESGGEVIATFTGRLNGLRKALRDHCPESPVLALLNDRAIAMCPAVRRRSAAIAAAATRS